MEKKSRSQKLTISNDEKERRIQKAKTYILLLVDILSNSDILLRKTLERYANEDLSPTQINSLVAEIEFLIENSTEKAIEIAKEKHNSSILIMASSPQLALMSQKELSQKITLIVTQFASERKLAGKPFSYYTNNLDKSTMQLAKLKAGLSVTANRSTTNLRRLIDQSVAKAFSATDLLLIDRDGAIGYMGFRNSAFDCAYCDSLCNRFLNIDEKNTFPAHPRCTCGIIPIYATDID